MLSIAMRLRPLVTATLLLLVTPLAGPAQSVQHEPLGRPFHMGFTPFPYDLTAQAIADTYDFVAAHGDLITFHHDNGVPWPEALAGNHAYHPDLIAEIDAEAAAIRPGKKVFVTCTPQSNARAGALAPYWGSDGGQPLPPGWGGKKLNDPDVIQAHLNWCRYLIQRLEPDWFAFAIECNGGFRGPADPDLLRFAALATTVHATLKGENPDLPILLTVQTGSTATTRTSFLWQTGVVLQSSDMVAISSYPFMVLEHNGFTTYTDPDDLPDDLLTAIVELAPGKPVAISETGYIAEDLVVPAFGLSVQGRPAWQRRYVQRLLTEADRLGAEFVVWFVPRDYDQLLDTLANLGFPVDPSFLIWRDNGLLDGAGIPRPALQVWDRWLGLPKNR